MRAVGPAGRNVGVRHRGDLRPLACLRTKGVAVQHDLVIRAGTVLDGIGSEPRTADVAVDGDRIVEVGRVDGTGRREIDADGALVTPGFVDIHTHYDGQATWDAYLAPSSWHGVTTVVMGNCGVGFAPVPPGRPRPPHRADGGRGGHPRRRAARGPRVGVGELPRVPRRDRAPRRTTSTSARRCRTAPLRLYVMGERGADRERRHARRRSREMGRIGRAARRGRRARLHDVAHDQPPHQRRASRRRRSTADADELRRHRRGLGEAGTGVLQVVSDFVDFDDEIGMLRRRWSRRPAGRCRSRSPRPTARARPVARAARPRSSAAERRRAADARRRWRPGPSACCSGCSAR